MKDANSGDAPGGERRRVRVKFGLGGGGFSYLGGGVGKGDCRGARG